MKRVLTIGLVIALLLASSMVGIAKTKVRLSEVVHSIFYAPQYVALHKDFFGDEELEVELSTAWGGDKAATTLMANHADIALIGPEPTIYIYQEGADNYLVNFAQLTQRAGSFLVARKPMPNFSLEDVRGKTIIGNRPGGAPEMVMEYTLRHNGIEPFEDVEIITNLDFTANAPAFKNGLGDFVQLFEPKASQLEKMGAGHVVASFGELGGNLPYTVYMARKNYIAENPKVIQKFTDAIYCAQQWTYSHTPEEIAEVIRPSFPNLDFDILVKVIKRYKDQDTWAYNPSLDRSELDYWQDIIIEAGELEEKVDYDNIVNPEFAKNTIKNSK
ncbi:MULTISPECIES: ABC transporter substrate-binding protein [unclassified Candidatus Frackibacter]|uniref:ABC transporter substrate-binding protein n=1 Tax=unclassified Candidatus Frackibacter TaxID=2648818 RepID=UPI0007943B34|nr:MULTISPECIES: ABC transporter substrate-binding protein [unclassified Candidatus Frackibacter]KXS40276.1 MAG: NitT/TauT family transport system substrate-binding protein [Candidatus Frackibacter sp. T328-2]SDC37170.1 NitT/TauT family transport system substrate-binding protein [Candidatus Frackibacter sp. WG11]SEM62838.1 NitT/TauT family transport system substrate-binding protein [Candidatus Frackibacter sp. WG12]SFL64900.1 NitT/TauT family transport system substrate-binding protein [Candidat